MTAPACGSCKAPVGDSAYLCQGCTRDLAGQLLLAASIAGDLDDATAKLLKRGSGGPRSEADAPLPIDLAASEAGGKLYGVLAYWANRLGGVVLTRPGALAVALPAQAVRTAMEGISLVPEERCELTELLASQCAHCTGADKRAAERPAEPGPWFFARYDGTCSDCAEPFASGQKIRADGDGGYVCEDCE